MSGHASPGLDRARAAEALAAFLDQAMPDGSPIEYRIVGTAAALLQGVALPASDIDMLLRRREDVDALAAAASAFLCLQAPIWLAGSRQYFARLEVRGVVVELSTVEVATTADALETVGSGPWEHWAPVAAGRRLAPAVALELRLATEVLRARSDRVEPLLQFLLLHGCDMGLLRRALAAAGVSRERSEDIAGRAAQAAMLRLDGG